MGFGRKQIFDALFALVLASVLFVACAFPAFADLGDRVTNVATVSQDSSSGSVVQQTNEAAFIIEARTTPSEIEFFRIVQNAPDGLSVQLNGADHSPSGELSGSFIALDRGTLPGDAATDPATRVDLVAAETYVPGETMVVRVIDLGQNGDPSRIETVVITVETDGGDTIVLRLYEDGPNSGHFYGFFPSSAEASAVFDETLSAPQDSLLTATYVDVFDATEVSVDTALVDPFGRVFDSLTGELLSDVSVTIIDVDTGLPAQVLGIDGLGTAPSTVLTSKPVTDSSGKTYPTQTGAFFFPVLTPGTYQILVEAPTGYAYPSARVAADFEALPNAPFDIWTQASYAGTFTVTTSGPLNLDIPLDPNSDLIVRKQAFEAQASVGDFVGYTIELENAATLPAPVRLKDTLPAGFRYVAGSSRLSGVQIPDPAIDPDGRDLTFVGGLLPPGERIELTYLASVGPRAQLGEAVNHVVAISPSGAPLSNAAEAAVQIEEDFLTSRLTIVGRVAEAACRPDEEWARTIEDGAGVAGVRLYMETGRYVVTDADGLFHFEGVRPGTHVVQVDAATLPPGYEPIVCEENTRYAGSALSKFVDAQGGTIWRANFYLRRIGVAKTEVDVIESKSRDEDLFDETWLNAQSEATFAWAYPRIGQSPAGRSVNLGLVHEPRQKVSLTLNGQAVSGLNFSGKDLSATRNVAISRWAGVDIQRGENTFTARLYDENGVELETLTRSVWFVDEVARARLVDDQSIAVADGRTKPVIAVRLEDGAGHPVHEGRIVEISVAAPYRLAQEAEEEFEAPVDAGFSAVSGIRVGADGIALVELEPTLDSGRARLEVQLADGSVEEIDIWLESEKRDWIVVGVAEAEGMSTRFADADDPDINRKMADGRLAFFAKGVVKGDWLLTIAVDTAKRRGDADGEIFDEIDPNAYYTLYGDRTWQHNNAESRYPVYVKLEKNTFQALFGDYETGFTETDLGRYARRLSGLKADYESETLTVTAFASQTNQTFVKDELAADGTSGPFRLRSAPLVRSSEVISVETRDRFRADQVLAVRRYNRYVDYDIDYTTGEIFFRQPVDASDAALNPNVIVIDYETSEAGERGITAGLRAATRLADGKVQTGITLVHEEDGASQGFDGSRLAAADLTVTVDESTEIRAEVATTEANTELGDMSGDAVLIEATRRTEKLSMTGYYRQETEGFGLGQQASNTSALRRIGAQISAEIGVQEIEGSNDRSVRRVEAQAYRETNLSQGAQRTVADALVTQDSQTFGASIGLRAVAEEYDSEDDDRRSVLLLAGLRKTFLDQGLTVSAVWEEPLNQVGANDEATLFPGRTVLGLDKTLGKTATLNLRHEITNGDHASGQNTVAGITWEPRGGTQIRAGADMLTQESARRIGATVGVDQVWQVNDAWTLSGGLARRANVDGGDAPLEVAPDAAFGPLEDGVRSPLTQSEQYTSAYLGAGFQIDGMAASGRIEARDSTSGKRLVAVLGGAREITKTLSFSAAARQQKESLTDQANRKQTDLRIGAAWRPRGEGVVVLNRFDYGHMKEDGVQNRSKLVNNLAVNAMVSKRTQLSIYHGVKHVETDFNGASASGFTHLIGGEVRHDVTKKFDLGFHATWTSGDASSTQAWSYGPSIGFSPEKNVWISVGWNASGFDDDDFEAAKYKQEGPYIKLRAKFDQNTIKALVEDLGLGAN
ncbi:MAG: hypothetical protein NXH78_15330 [Hyphomonadaceae bacterium]|nr:hypothetical protein [Hyphomonadaceae bacterium]